MTNLKNIISEALKGNQVDTAFNELSKSQENLLKNFLNPVFPEKAKKKILKGYNDLKNIGKSLYRFKTLQAHNYLESEQEQADDIENILLKGGISRDYYVWHSEDSDNTCDACKSLDGQIFDFYDDVPERPHPNCRCSIELVEYDGENQDFKTLPEQEEPCDCWDKIDALVEEANTMQAEIDPLIVELDNIENEDLNLFVEIKKFKEQVEVSKSELINIEPCGEHCVAALMGMAVNISDDKDLEEGVGKILNWTKESRQVYKIFLDNKHEMEVARDGMDKYYHAKANCTAAELGFMYKLWAIALSVGKEFKDYYHKVFELHMDFREVFNDCLQDLRADWYGIQKAKEHGYCSDKVKNVYEDVFHKK